MKKRVLIMLVAVLLVGLFCGASAANNKFKGIKLNFIVETGPHGMGVRAIAEEWQKETGAKVTFTVLPGWPEMYERVKLDLSTGRGMYDLIQCNWTWLPEIYRWLEPLDPYLKRDNVDYLNNPDFFSTSVKGGRIKDITVATILSSEWMSWGYRTDLFQEAGIAEVPVELNELLQAAEKLNSPEKGVYGFAGMAKRGVYPYWHYFWILSAMGGRIFDEKGSPTLDPVEHPEALEALEYMKKLYTYTPPESSGWSHFPAYGAFSSGRTAMCVLWSASQFEHTGRWPKSKINMLTGSVKFRCAVPPGCRLSNGTIRRGHSSEGWYLAMNKYSRHKEAVWDFMKSLLYNEAYREKYAKIAWPCLYRKSQFKWSITHMKDMGITRENVEAELRAGETAISEPHVPYYMEFTEILGTELNAALTGIKSPRKALKDANTQLVQLVSKR